MKFYAGDGAVALLRTAISAVAAVLAAGTVIAARFWLPSLWGLLPVTAAWVAAAFWLAPRFKRSVRGTFDAGNVRVEYGVWWRRELFIPLSSLRTFEIWAPPLHRLFRCRTVVLRFAGGAAVLPLLSCDIAAALTAELERNEE